jgi:mRNA interferase MazF
MVDLGMVAKTRPVLIFNVPFQDDERALYAVVPHTTALRGGRFEVAVNVSWLEHGALMFKGCATSPAPC